MGTERILAVFIRFLIKHRLLKPEEWIAAVDPADPGLSIYATTKGRGNGASLHSPCSMSESMIISKFLSAVNPKRRNRIFFKGDPVVESFTVMSKKEIKEGDSNGYTD